jgi:hypothetical protein
MDRYCIEISKDTKLPQTYIHSRDPKHSKQSRMAAFRN